MERKRLNKTASNSINQRLGKLRSKRGNASNSRRYEAALQPIENIEENNLPEYEPETGRPIAIADPEVYQTIIEAVTNGNFISTAAKLAGVSYNTVIDSIEKGQKGKNELYYKFWQDIVIAEAEAESRLLGYVMDEAALDYKAALEILQRRFPQWAKKDQHHVRHEHSGQVQHTVRNTMAEKILENKDMRDQARSILRNITKDVERVE